VVAHSEGTILHIRHIYTFSKLYCLLISVAFVFSDVGILSDAEHVPTSLQLAIRTALSCPGLHSRRKFRVWKRWRASLQRGLLVASRRSNRRHYQL
jgi:hypothetical protein